MRYFDTQSLEEIVRKVNRVDEGGEEWPIFFIDKYEKIKGDNYGIPEEEE